MFILGSKIILSKEKFIFPKIVGHVNIQLLMNDSNFEELKSEELYNFINLTFLNRAHCRRYGPGVGTKKFGFKIF